MDTRHIEQVTLALYRVTDRMDDNEPLKWKLRQCALNLSDIFFGDSQVLTFQQEDMQSRRLLVLFKEMERMLALGGSLTYVSQANFEVLKREYIVIEKAIFQDAPLLSEEKTEEKNSPGDSEVRAKKNFTVQKRKEHQTSQSMSDRKQKIIDFLSNVRHASIGDLVLEFQGSCSEKTIQRDLVDLMTQGEVRAEGEKRWRKYLLIQK